MRSGRQHMPIIRPDLNESGISWRDQMQVRQIFAESKTLEAHES
jgi:hypothetical protein